MIKLSLVTLIILSYNYLYIMFFILVFIEVRLLIELITCLCVRT